MSTDVVWTCLHGPQLRLWLGPGAPLGTDAGGASLVRFHRGPPAEAREREDRGEHRRRVRTAVEAVLEPG